MLKVFFPRIHPIKVQDQLCLFGKVQAFISVPSKSHMRQISTSGKTATILSTVLKNNGSTARDNLANERTFLAWARTGLAFVGAGLGYFYASTEDETRLKDVNCSNVPAVTGLLAANGVVFLSFATYRYFYISSLLEQGKFPLLNRTGMLVVILSTGVTTLSSLALIVDDRLQLNIVSNSRR
eukprot:CAMPEP_0184020558 /NCGR_PEP_ID=MMETSP0954-20121128/9412_1 /TAXON_ID=627963 /ORGANISM="Aplanochytrium sp, Strain PBS07" /LENGTH=181 /DNA_ID=CAMNT_0026302425 /DNA_START=190 /DNA_END=735 /DNA_ORIENTATION=+